MIQGKSGLKIPLDSMHFKFRWDMNKFYRTLGKITLFLIIALFSGCSMWDWGSKAFDKLPEKTALDEAYRFSGKVIVVGAGASGLAAANILEKNNIDYEIIEATDRYGGRLKKAEGFADFPIDLGAEWIHNLPQILNRLKGKPGNEVEEVLIPYQLDSSYSWDGKHYKAIPKSKTDKYFNGFPEYKFKYISWYDFLDQNFAQQVKHKIRFNTPVKALDYTGEKVKVVLKNGETIAADKVLLTVSIGVLKSGYIQFTPTLDKDKQKAIESIQFLPGFKLAMKFSEKFYPDVISCKTKTGTKDYHDVAFQKDTKENVLGLLSTGSSTEAYYELGSEEAIVSAVLKELDQIFDGRASKTYLGEYLFQDWGRQEFTLGSWTSSWVSQSTLEDLNRSLEKKIYFSGGANDIYRQQGVPGSIMSGYYAIDRLLKGKE